MFSSLVAGVAMESMVDGGDDGGAAVAIIVDKVEDLVEFRSCNFCVERVLLLLCRVGKVFDESEGFNFNFNLAEIVAFCR